MQVQWCERHRLRKHQIRVRWSRWHGTLGTPKSRRSCPDLSSSPPAPQGTPVFAARFRCVLVDSRPACQEGPAMDPLRFPGIPHPSAPD